MFTIKNIYSKFRDFIKDNYKFILAIILINVLFWYELPYQVYIPGGTIDLSERVIVEDGYSSKGSFNSSYVSAIRGSVPYLLLSYIIPDWDIIENSKVTIDKESISEVIARDKELLQQSFVAAQVIAMDYANIDYEITKHHVKVLFVYSASKSNLQAGDEIVSINNTQVTNINDISNILDNLDDNAKITVRVIRNSKTIDINSELVLMEGKMLLGVYLTTIFDIKTEKKIDITSRASESGSSGGLMTALALYDALTKEDITKGKKIVGTGTIELDGSVGEIGGVKYKLMGANKAKADIFICPLGNYEEAVKIAKEKKYKIKIYGVSTFEEALKVLENM